jgi:hypothetical protein
MHEERRVVSLSRCLWLNAIAISFSLVRVQIDFGLVLIVLSELVWLEGALLAFLAFVYGWWAWSLARAGRDSRSGLVSMFAMCLLWAGGNGAAGLLSCPPPCGGLIPYNPLADISHIGSLVFGAGAAFTTWKVVRANSLGRNQS